VTASTRRGPGRPSDGADRRADILDAARHEFASKGYDGATVRAIARAASVDPALVHHYFGTKERVFTEAMALPMNPSEVLPDMLEGDPAGIGERFARLFFSLWSDEDFRRPMLAMLRSATTSEQGAQMLREFVGTALLARLAANLGAPDAALRASAAAAQLVGLALLRYVIEVPPVVAATEDELVALVAPTLQRYLVP
jgi:AcrR family transcriptional regulator